MAQPLITNFNLSYPISDVYYSQNGGLFRADYDHLLEGLEKLQKSQNLSQSYLDNVVEPLINYLLYQLPKDKFDRIFSTHEENLTTPEKNIKSVLPILAEALLQRNYDGVYYKSAFDDLLAFQSIVNTIYELANGATSTPMPPLVAWNRKIKGPFTMTAAQIGDKMQIPIGIICLPPEYRNGGLFAWSVMGHEVAGHNFIQSKPGLLDELVEKVKDGIRNKLESKFRTNKTSYKPEDLELLANYWSIPRRVEELASDVLGILSTGPALAIGCIGYLRGTSQDGHLKTTGPFEAQKQKVVLHIQNQSSPTTSSTSSAIGNSQSNTTTKIEALGPLVPSSDVNLYLKDLSEKVKIKESHGILGITETQQEIHYRAYKILSSPHPIQALRPFAMAETIIQTNLNEDLKARWVELITNEVLSKEFSKDKFVKIIKINPQPFPPQEEEKTIPLEIARLSAEVVANIITTTKLSVLGCCITTIFNWTMSDETQVASVRECYQAKKPKLPRLASTNHIVAGAVMETSILNADIENLFQTMKKYLIQAQSKT